MKVLKKIDKFGHPIGLNYNNKGTHTTVCGSIISLIIYTLMCGLIVKKVIVLVNYDNDTIHKNEEIFDPTRYIEHQINLKDTGIIPSFMLARP